MAAQGLSGMVLMPGPNMLYVSGMHAHVSERPMLLFLPVGDDPAVIIPALEAMKAGAAGISETRIFHWHDEDGYAGAFQKAVAALELDDHLWGVEALHMRVLELELLHRQVPGLATAHAEPIMSALRMVKDAAEIAAMERAVDVAQRAMGALLPRIRVGMTEKRIAALLLSSLMDSGADRIAFDPIVSAGPNSASPHAVPTDRPLQSGDLLVIDWGCFVDDYPSDITRTFAVGEIDPELERIYATVKLANQQGRATSAPGVSACDVDDASRGVTGAAGYAAHFIHRTGHGLGLEIHEPPFITKANTQLLEAGMVFTVEPGIYLPGRGGVRIEDDVVIMENGHRSLTTFPRELITVG